MADAQSAAASEGSKPKKKGLRFKTVLVILLLLGLAGAGAYGASWLNARRYFLIIDKTEARIAKGRFFPTGHHRYRTKDATLKKAYQRIPLPGGMKLERGEKSFIERVELDQAVFTLLKTATEFSISLNNKRTAELTSKYVEQMKALQGINAHQQMEVAKLERDLRYLRAKHALTKAREMLKEAAKTFHDLSNRPDGRYADGDLRARAIERALEELDRLGSGKPAPKAPPIPPTAPPKQVEPPKTPPPAPVAPPPKKPEPAPIKTSTTTPQPKP